MQKIPLTKQIPELIKVAGLPATIVAVIGDFFSAQGGWLVVAALGMLGLAVSLFFVFTLTGEPDCVQQKKWFGMVSDDPEFIRNFVGNHAVTIPAVNIPAAFGIACLVMANWSYAAAQDGGFVAQNVDMVKGMQLQIGLMQRQLDVSTEIHAAVLAVKDNTQGLKKETSDDPRKEVANLGFAWSTSDFYKSLRQDNRDLVALYLQGGMPLDHVALHQLMSHGSDELLALVAAQGKVKHQAVCDEGLESLNFRDEARGTSALQLLGQLCDNDPTRAYADRRRKEAEQAYAADVAEQQPKFQSVEQCFQTEWQGDGRQIVLDALEADHARALKGSVPARVLMLLEVKSLLIEQQPHEKVAGRVRQYCQQHMTRPVEADSSDVTKWQKIVKSFS